MSWNLKWQSSFISAIALHFPGSDILPLGKLLFLFFLNTQTILCTIQPKFILCIWTPISLALYLQSFSCISETGGFYTSSVIWNYCASWIISSILLTVKDFECIPVANHICSASWINSCFCAVDYIYMSMCERKRNPWRLRALFGWIMFPAL